MCAETIIHDYLVGVILLKHAFTELELLVSWPVETATCRPYPPTATIACATTWTTFRTLS